MVIVKPSTKINHFMSFDKRKQQGYKYFSVEMHNIAQLPCIDTIVQMVPQGMSYIVQTNPHHRKLLRQHGIEFTQIMDWTVLNQENLRYLCLCELLYVTLVACVHGEVTPELIVDLTKLLSNKKSVAEHPQVELAIEFIGQNSAAKQNSVVAHVKNEDYCGELLSAQLIFLLESLYPDLNIQVKPPEYYLNQMGPHFMIDVAEVSKFKCGIQIPLEECSTNEQIWLSLPQQRWSFE